MKSSKGEVGVLDIRKHSVGWILHPYDFIDSILVFLHI